MSNNQSNGNQNSGNNGRSPPPSNSQSQRNNTNGPTNGRNNRPTIPDEIGNPDCPVCLSRVENRAYTNSCLHEFCFPCIKEWSQAHNRCPVCREVYQKILHNIRSKQEYDEEEVAEPPDQNNGILLIIGGLGLLITPSNTGLYVIDPVPTSQGIHYNIEYYGPNQRVILPFLNPNMVIVPPDRLEQTLQAMNAHPHHPHHGSHPYWLRRHSHNH